MLCSFLLPLLIPVGLVVFFRILNKPSKPAIFGVYQQKNKFYCFKFLFMYATLRIKQVCKNTPLCPVWGAGRGQSNNTLLATPGVLAGARREVEISPFLSAASFCTITIISTKALAAPCPED